MIPDGLHGKTPPLPCPAQPIEPSPHIFTMNRRDFLQLSSTAVALAAASRPLLAAATAKPKIALGMDNFAIRAMGWKAPALIDYAASLKLDSLDRKSTRLNSSHT